MGGDLKAIELPEAIRKILTEKQTGKLRIASGPLEKCIFFKNGEVVFATSNQPDERLGEMLHREGKISDHDRETASVYPLPGKKFGDTLVAMGKIAQSDLDEMVKKQVTTISASAFLLQDKNFRFSEDATPPQEVGLPKVSTFDIILDAIRQMPFSEEMRSALGNPARPLKLTADSYRIADLVSLKPTEGFVLSRIDGVATLSEIAPLVPAAEFDTYKFLYGLRVLGLLVESPMRGTPADAIRKDAGPRPSGAARPSPAGGSGAGGSGDRDVEALFTKLDSLTFYQLLDVPLTASAAEIKKTYYRIAKIYHPDRFQATGQKDLQKKAESVFARMTEAYEVLVDEKARIAYDHKGLGHEKEFQREERREERMAEKEPRESPEKAAQEQYAKGMEHYNARRYTEAIEALSQATKLSPRKGEYFIALGWAQAKNPATKKEAEKTFLRAVNLDKLSADPYVAMGKYYKEMKDYEKALALLQRALALDDEHEEAQKELSSLPGQEPEKKSFWSRLTGR